MNVYRVNGGNPEGKRHYGNPGVHRRKILMDLRGSREKEWLSGGLL
jgi:hypothetical protein